MDTRPFSSDCDTSAAFKLLDSPNREDVKAFIENLKKYEKEPWVMENLMTYYLATDSAKASDLVAGAHSSHDKLIFKRLHSAFDEAQSRSLALKLLLHIVSKKPPWLHKIVDERIFSDIIKCMKKDVCVPILMQSVYLITMLLPVIPDGIIKSFDSIFDAFIRLVSFTFYNREREAEVLILHLNVGIYSLFSRLYGMYPWHIINSLQEYHSRSPSQRQLYKQAIEPMLFSVKFNPLIVTVSKEKEVRGEQWLRKAAHDIVAECASLSLDSAESTQDLAVRCPVLISKDHDRLIQAAVQAKDPAGGYTEKLTPTEYISAPVGLAKDSHVSMVVNSSNFFSPSDRLNLSTPPPNDPSTPGFANSQQPQFTFVTPNTSTPPPALTSIKTPQNSSHNTPNHYTPTPNPLEESSCSATTSRSRHTSGNKGSISRISYDDRIPESPLYREFTAEPPKDVQRVLSEPAGGVPIAERSSELLSLTNLPQVLEKISDTTSTHGSLPANNSDDEEVTLINQQTDIRTSRSVAEFMKTFNRIRFNSINVSMDKDCKSGVVTTHRPTSCPPFTGEIVEPKPKSLFERSTSIQTKSSVELASKAESRCSSLSEMSQPPSADPALSLATSKGVQPASHLIDSLPASHNYGNDRELLHQGPCAKLDERLLLNNQMTLASAVYQQQVKGHAVGSIHPSADRAELLDTGRDTGLIRSQIALLHTQLLYERQKRELHAERNRRLLSKIAKAEKYREENSILKDKLKRLETDVFNLQMTHRLQTSEIQRLKDEQTRSDSSREEELASLIRQNEWLKCSKEELQRELDSQQEKCRKTEQRMSDYMGQVEILEQHLDVAQDKMSSYVGYEQEVCRMKKELLFMGEIQAVYEEKLSSLSLLKYDDGGGGRSGCDNEIEFLSKLDEMKETMSKQKELLKLKQSQLEQTSAKLKEKDSIIKGHQQAIHLLRGEHRCMLEAMEDKYQMSVSSGQTLEFKIMSLYDQIGRLTIPTPKRPPSTDSVESTQ